MAKKVMMPVVLKVPGMDMVKVVENLKYTKSDDPNVLMDIYVPPDLSENEKRPTRACTALTTKTTTTGPGKLSEPRLSL